MWKLLAFILHEGISTHEMDECMYTHTPAFILNEENKMYPGYDKKLSSSGLAICVSVSARTITSFLDSRRWCTASKLECKPRIFEKII